jgi:hypothetical protein
LRNILAEPQLVSHFSKCFEKYIKPIQEYDKTHDGALIKTLQIYLKKTAWLSPARTLCSSIINHTLSFGSDITNRRTGFDGSEYAHDAGAVHHDIPLWNSRRKPAVHDETVMRRMF